VTVVFFDGLELSKLFHAVPANRKKFQFSKRCVLFGTTKR